MPSPKNMVSTTNEMENAVKELLRRNAANTWFINEYWPENRNRVVQIVSDVCSRFPVGSSLLDIGCGTGYISFLFSRLGYSVCATDVWDLPERDDMFRECNVDFFSSNLNDLDPFKTVRRQFDVVLMGEVIEHILNCPVDLIKSAAAVARAGALLILSTPNPATVMNAWRLLRNHYSLWGTRSFIEQPKIKDGRIISDGDIHYREYSGEELRWMLETAELSILEMRYLSIGSSRTQPVWKRLIKNSPVAKAILATRLCAPTHYVLAEKKVDRLRRQGG